MAIKVLFLLFLSFMISYGIQVQQSQIQSSQTVGLQSRLQDWGNETTTNSTPTILQRSISICLSFFVLGCCIMGLVVHVPIASLNSLLQEMNIEATACIDEDTRADEYQFGKLMGNGIFGDTYETVHHGFTYAVRKLPNEPYMLQLVKQEVKYQSCFSNSTFMEFWAYHVEQDFIYLCMEFPTFGPMNFPLDAPVVEILDRIDEKQASKLVLDVINAIQSAQSHLVGHRRITVDKLFLSHGENVRIADYGYCVLEERQEHTEVDDVIDMKNLARSLLSHVSDWSYGVDDFLCADHKSLEELTHHWWLKRHL